jgi:hypothetical protein
MEGVRGNNSSTTANPTMMQLDMKHVSGELLCSFAYATLLLIIRLGLHSCSSHLPASLGFPASTPPAQYGIVLVDWSTKMDIHHTFLASMDPNWNEWLALVTFITFRWCSL